MKMKIDELQEKALDYINKRLNEPEPDLNNLEEMKELIIEHCQMRRNQKREENA